MNITQENSGTLTALVHINLKEEDYIGKVNAQLKDHRKKAQMPGFRPGMVPMGMIKKMYGKAVLADEVNKTISDALNNYIYENKINILGYPMPNEEKTAPIDFDTQNEFDLYFDLGLAPELEVNISEDIKVPYYSIKVTDDEVETATKDTQKRLGEEEHPETAELDDTIHGKIQQLDEAGMLLEEGYSVETSFVLGDLKLKTIQDLFIGKEKGVKVVFNPMKALEEEDKVKTLLKLEEADDRLKADYEIEITDIVRVKEAELNEEFFKKVYPSDDLKTAEDFSARIREDLSQHYQNDADKQFVGDTITEVIARVNPELPDEFLKRWLLENNKEKATKEQIEEQYDGYAKTFKWQLIENKLIEEFGDALKVSEEEVRNKVRAYFQMAGGEESNPQVEGIVDQILSNDQEKERIYGELMDERYITFFKEKISKEEKEATPEEFVKIISTPKE